MKDAASTDQDQHGGLEMEAGAPPGEEERAFSRAGSEAETWHLSGQGPGQEASDADQDSGTRGFVVHDRRFWTLDEAELQAEESRPRQPAYVEQLQTRLEEKEQQLREYIAAYKREVVEGLEKTKQRLQRDAEAREESMRGEMAMPMVEVLDVLERSLAAAESSASTESLHEGIKMVHLLMVQKLQELGLQRIEAVGQPFDPQQHEALAVARVSDPAQHNVVLMEFKPGFKLKDRVVRPAQVQVGRFDQ